MKVITFDDIKKLQIDPGTCYEWVSAMIRDKRSADLPPKISLSPAEGAFCNFMPCIIPDTPYGKIGGVKVVNRYPERQPSLDSKLLLIDMDTGEFQALMDANWITAMRTGAVATHSIRLLAKKDFSTVGILGLGNTARATMLCMAAVFADRELSVKLLRYKGQEELFAERFAQYPKLHFSFADTNEDVIRGSDVVLSCVTYAAGEMASDDCFGEGVLVVPVHTRGFMNCDLFFDKVFADDTGHVCHFKNYERFRQFAEVCDVVNGLKPGRENDRERILAYNIGLSVHDINFAAHIYSLMKDDAVLTELDLRDPTEKFWI